MSTVIEIESAICQLPQDDFWKLAEWFDEARADARDRHSEERHLDHLWEAAQLEIGMGETVMADELFRRYASH